MHWWTIRLSKKGDEHKAAVSLSEGTDYKCKPGRGVSALCDIMNMCGLSTDELKTSYSSRTVHFFGSMRLDFKQTALQTRKTKLHLVINASGVGESGVREGQLGGG